MTERLQLENGSASRHNTERSATDDHQEGEEYRTEAPQKALVVVTDRDWDEQ